MLKDFTLYRWDFFIVPNELYNDKKDFEEFFELINSFAKESFEWIGKEEPIKNLKNLYIAVKWQKENGFAKKLLIKRYLDGVIFLRAYAKLGEYNNESLKIDTPKKYLKPKFYLGNKEIKVAEIEKNFNIESFKKKYSEEAIKCSFGYIFLKKNLFLVYKNRVQEFAQKEFLEFENIFFSLSKLKCIKYKTKSLKEKLLKIEKKINNIITQTQIYKKELNIMESIVSNLGELQIEFEHKLKDLKEYLLTLKINKKNIETSLNTLPNLPKKEYLMPIEYEIAQLEVDLNYFELTKTSIVNIQNNYQTLTNIKNTQEEKRLNRAVAILTLTTILQLFQTDYLREVQIMGFFIGLVTLILIIY